MAAKPETAFIKRIHNQFKNVGVKPYFEKMHNSYRGGTWDVWYSGKKGDFWIEYKWTTKKNEDDFIIPPLTPLQAKWGRQRYKEGRRLAVVFGSPLGCLVYYDPASWEEGIRSAYFTERDIAQWIADGVGEGDDSPASSTRSKNRRVVL